MTIIDHFTGPRESGVEISQEDLLALVREMHENAHRAGRRLPGRLALAEAIGVSAESTERPVLLELIHLGTSIRTMEVRADVNDFSVLEKLLRSAVRRSGGELDQIDDYELEVRIPGQTEPVTTVVVAA